VQLFDSWVGCLSPDDYRQYVLPHTQHVINNVTAGVPVLHFGTGTAALLELMRAAGGDVIGIDWRVRFDEAWARIGYDAGIMGNLTDRLIRKRQYVRAEAKHILEQAAGRPGHFQPGHGIHLRHRLTV
jgi:uroporphyrinogen decarboxylase